MRACVFEAKGRFSIREVPTPSPGPGEVLVRVKVAGICGTDVHILRGEYFQDFPIVAGHEFAGEVVALGEGVEGFSVGERVTADPNIFCDRCYFCKINKNNHCVNFAALGVTRDGAFAEYVTVPAKCLFPLPEGLSFAEGALAEPLACAVYGVQRSHIRPGEKVLIFGAGPIGLLLLSLFRVSGASQVVVVDISEKKLELAMKRGASDALLADGKEGKRLKEIAPFGFEVVVDATGVPEVMEKALGYVEPDGTFLLFGVAPRGASMRLEPYEVFRRDLRIVGSFAVKKTMQYALNLLGSGAVAVRDLVSSQYPLERFGDALEEVLTGKDRLKVQIVCEP
ncbi:MAG: zinc-dependent alcohol dehydrogenase family protein [Candidatus Caldatribacterium sp.]|uniref:zinc-dependent alcohol dehydrogenase family protein n=1 Tax=Candidatus Caldatribacterium sp. TaxID=2282143 RepID=UPI002996C65B|nr:zinc-dependent alcohol dehydrogenase family protein [Candidatus Caldatribacterium sp.]MCX7730009.1 zinc-dependent alcohol dehydrogenase family protein [Candidatus Caldatribacterium sp.]MDW8081657.1 zinc-dependent alcohol dehydrogenase family protein [Candidatus Calescibacterium sp.]